MRHDREIRATYAELGQNVVDVERQMEAHIHLLRDHGAQTSEGQLWRKVYMITTVDLVQMAATTVQDGLTALPLWLERGEAEQAAQELQERSGEKLRCSAFPYVAIVSTAIIYGAITVVIEPGLPTPASLFLFEEDEQIVWSEHQLDPLHLAALDMLRTIGAIEEDESDTSEPDEDATILYSVATTYLLQQERYISLLDAGRFGFHPASGRPTFFIQLLEDGEELDFEIEGFTELPNAAVRRAAFLRDLDGEYHLIVSFGEDEEAVEEEVRAKAYAYLLDEIGPAAMRRMVRQWRRHGPWAELDPDASQSPGDWEPETHETTGDSWPVEPVPDEHVYNPLACIELNNTEADYTREAWIVAIEPLLRDRPRPTLRRIAQTVKDQLGTPPPSMLGKWHDRSYAAIQQDGLEPFLQQFLNDLQRDLAM
jgi:hypothetical protein